MTSRTDKLGMSLDEIIKMNKKKPVSGPGSVVSRASQQSRGRRIGKGKKNYQSNVSAVAVQGRFQGQGGRFNQVISAPRGLQILPVRQRKAFRANKSVNSLRSDQIVRIQKQQAVQQKLNRARALKSGWFMDKNSVTGSSDMLTVCIANDLAAKRLGHKQHANIIKKFGQNNSFIRKYGRNSFTRHNNNDGKNSNNNYNPRHRAMSATSRSSSVVDISPEGSIVTTISQYSQASSVGHNQRAGSVIRGVRQNRAPPVEQYVPVTKVRSALNLQLQKEIAAIQGKTFQLSTNSLDFTAHGSGSSTAFGLSGFKPIPSLTATTLNERFSLAL